MSISTGWKIGIGVGAAALAAIIIASLSSKSSAATTSKQPPGGRPPSENTSPVTVDENGGVQLAPGNMGTLTLSGPNQGVNVYVPNASTDKLVSMTSSNEGILPASNVAGEAAASFSVLNKGTTTLTFTWLSGEAQNTSTITVVAQ